MKHSIRSLIIVFLSTQALGVIEIGQTVSNLCWKDSGEKTICLDDHKDSIRVLLYNGGWCGPCNQEFRELVPRIGEFSAKPVTFISLSGSGWEPSALPNTRFLQEWKARHKIPFPVCASPKDHGKVFFSPPIYIPNVVIVDKNGRLALKEVNPGVGVIFQKIRELLK